MDSEIKQKRGRKKAFVPPTLDDVQAYMDEIGECRFQAEKFWLYYEAKGWMLGKSRMKSWKIVLGNWIERENKKGKLGKPQMVKPQQNVVKHEAYKPVDTTGAVSYLEYLRMKNETPLPALPRGRVESQLKES